MINNNNFSKRLKKILDYYQLSASAFADKVGVQRSSISHLLSGRNKPSLDFVLKVLDTFNEVELYWLLRGEGSFPKNIKDPDNKIDSTPNLFSHLKEKETINKDEYNAQDNNNQSDIPIKDIEIERIVIFYKNGTFKSYRS
jgi:transcriptional regulator with XRE-family HTH domain